MTLITDAEKLLDTCRRTENLIFDAVSFGTNCEGIVKIRDLIKQVPKITNKCRKIQNKLLKEGFGIKTTHCHDLLRMTMRLEAAILYAKNHFKID